MRNIPSSKENKRTSTMRPTGTFVFILIIATMVSLTIMICSASGEVEANDTGTCGDGVTYIYSESNKTLDIQFTGTGTGDMTDYNIPSSEPPWYKKYDIETVTIENGVRTIGNMAFFLCEHLKVVTIPNSVKTIGKSAFSGCTSLKSITIPDSVTYIGEEAFTHCTSFISITLPDSVKNTGSTAFGYCTSLSSITLSSNIQSIATNAFTMCTSLKSITIPDSVTFIDYRAFSNCGSLESVSIPNSVIDLGGGTFDNCRSLKSITIPNSVTYIGEKVFQGCSSLEHVSIPESVKTIGKNAFSDCSSLKSITIPNSVKSIEEYAFSYCGFESVNIPNSITSIGNGIFYMCASLGSVNIPNSITSIGKNAFDGCKSLSSLILSDNISYIDDNAFTDCTGLTSIKFGNADLVIIGKNVFSITDIYYEKCKNISFKDSDTAAYKYDFIQEYWDKFKGKTYIGSYEGGMILTESPSQTHNVYIGMDNGIEKIRYGIGTGAYIDYSGPFQINTNQKLTVLAIMKNGYSFVRWSTGDTNNPYTIDNVTYDVNLNAVTQQTPAVTYNVTLGFDSGVEKVQYRVGTGTYADYYWPFQIESGQNLTVHAIMKDGYSFVRWSSGSMDNPYTIDNVTYDISLNAETGQAPTQTYTVTIGKDSGIEIVRYRIGAESYADYTSSFSIESGQKLTIQATMKDGYSFVRWASGITDNPYTIDNVTSNVNLSAVSEAIVKEFTVKVNVDPVNGGNVYGEGIYKPGSVVTLSATPADGWKFVRWSSQQVAVSDGKFVMPPMDVSVNAIFEETSTTSSIDPVFLAAGAVIICIAIGAVVFVIKR